MKITHNNFELANDVLRLYSSIKHSGLEDLFLKISNVNTGSFCQWLGTNRKVKTSLKNPVVYDALETLCNIRVNNPPLSKMDRGNMVKSFMESGGKGMSIFSIIIDMSKIVSDPSAKDILEPFSDIIGLIGMDASISGGNPSALLEDIIMIKDHYLRSEFPSEDEDSPRVRISIAQQKKNMFQHLLVRFSDEISAAFEKSGFTDLANDVKNEALSKLQSDFLSPYIENANSKNIQKAKIIAVDFIKTRYDTSWEILNHDDIEMAIGITLGWLTREQYKEMLRKREKNLNIIETLENNTKYQGYEDLASLITSEKKINPDYLLMIWAILVSMRQAVGLPV